MTAPAASSASSTPPPSLPLSMDSSISGPGGLASESRESTTAPTSTAPSVAAQTVPERSNGSSGASNSRALLRHLYDAGFRNGDWHDCIVHFKCANGSHQAFRLHTLIIVRSRRLRDGLMASHSREIEIHIADPHVNDESISICLQYLYGASTSDEISASNALSMLATAYWLQLDEVAQEAYAVATASITAGNVAEVLAFAQGADGEHAGPLVNGGPSSHESTSSSDSAGGVRYGAYGEGLIRATTEYLAKTLPVELGAFSDPPQPGGVEALIAALSRLDFELFRSVAETSPLPTKMKDRFAFLNRCVAARRKALGPKLNGEEQVMMAFAGSKGEIQVLKKPARRLAKVGPHASPR